MQTTSATTAVAALSLPTARVSIAAGALTLVLLAALHILSPEFNPSWRMVSEYALGSFGWVLALMFIVWAISAGTLYVTIRPLVQTAAGKVGLALLLISTAGTALAAIFDVRSSLHGLAALLGIPTLPVAAMLITVSLLKHPDWAPAQTGLLAAANFTWISLVLMFAAVFIGLAKVGEFGPGVYVGWPNRLLIVAYCVWMIAIARQALQTQAA